MSKTTTSYRASGKNITTKINGISFNGNHIRVSNDNKVFVDYKEQPDDFGSNITGNNFTVEVTGDVIDRVETVGPVKITGNCTNVRTVGPVTIGGSCSKVNTVGKVSVGNTNK